MKTAKAEKSKTTKVTKSKTTRAVAPKAAKSKAPAVKNSPSRAPKSVPTPAPAPVGKVAITTEEIARRAYAIWEQQGRPSGKEREHWLLAERQLKAA